MTKEEMQALCDEVPYAPETMPAGSYFIGQYGIVRIQKWTDGLAHLVGWKDMFDIADVLTIKDDPTLLNAGKPAADTPKPPGVLKFKVPDHLVVVDKENVAVEPDDSDDIAIERAGVDLSDGDNGTEPDAPEKEVVEPVTGTPTEDTGKHDYGMSTDLIYGLLFAGAPLSLKVRWDSVCDVGRQIEPIEHLLGAILTCIAAGTPVIGLAQAVLDIVDVLDLDGAEVELGKGFE